jgi:predicted O-methyltransferase YrrM
MHARLRRLNILLRTSAPERLRTAYRLVRSLGAAQGSAPLPAELVRDCRFCASRLDMLSELPRQGIVAELGTFRGTFARQILTRTDPRELHLVDVDFSRFDRSIADDKRVSCHLGLTHEIISAFPDRHFDWIYIDADHSYAGASRDARVSAPKLKPGGFLVFNDFAHIDPGLGRYGVHRAVVDFANETRWPFRFFAFERSALYDVALQKPET